PVLTACSTPGTAVLVTGFQRLTLNKAIGVSLFTTLLMFLCGLMALFARLIRNVPTTLASPLLAGL
ncbi:hypothetical protein GLP02_24300, partial [Escherichia coli]|nr:hypothetical protein [Escherichia coli]